MVEKGNQMLDWFDFMVFNAIFNITSVSYQPVYLSILSWSSPQYFFKPLAAFPLNNHQNNGQGWERSESSSNDYLQKNIGSLAFYTKDKHMKHRKFFQKRNDGKHFGKNYKQLLFSQNK